MMCGTSSLNWASEMFGELWERIPTAAQTTILSMHVELLHLQEELNELRARLGQNSSNSSKPPSLDPLWQRAARKKKPKSSRLVGAQTGHVGALRPLLESARVDEIVQYCPEQCIHCGSALASADEVEHLRKRRQLIELPVIKV